MSGDKLARPPSILEEIQQTKPFRSRSQEAYLALLRTADDSKRYISRVLDSAGVTLQQYNVLRILRGAGKLGLCRHEVRDRMVTPVPDVTRLLDRLEDKGLVARERDGIDRRLVTARITEDGLTLLEKLDRPLARTTKHLLGHMTEQELTRLGSLLVTARANA